MGVVHWLHQLIGLVDVSNRGLPQRPAGEADGPLDRFEGGTLGGWGTAELAVVGLRADLGAAGAIDCHPLVAPVSSSVQHVKFVGLAGEVLGGKGGCLGN